MDPEAVENIKIKTIVPIDNMTFPIDNFGNHYSIDEF